MAFAVALVASSLSAQDATSCTAGETDAQAAVCQRRLDAELVRLERAIVAGIRPGFPALLRSEALPKQRQLFSDAQTAWRRFRDLACQADAFENYDSSGYNTSVLECRITLTRQRISQLRAGPWGVLIRPAPRR